MLQIQNIHYKKITCNVMFLKYTVPIYALLSMVPYSVTLKQMWLCFKLGR